MCSCGIALQANWGFPPLGQRARLSQLDSLGRPGPRRSATENDNAAIIRLDVLLASTSSLRFTRCVIQGYGDGFNSC